MSDNPRGRLNLPRLTDIWPMVSHHRTPPSKCDVNLCFNGHTKEEVFRSVRDTYVNNVPRLKQKLEDNGVSVVDIVISGSLVKGDFGCRDPNKIRAEIDELLDGPWRNSEFGEEISDIVNSTDDAMLMWEQVNQAAERRKEGMADYDKEEIDIKVDDTLIAICSDVDMFIVFPDSDTTVNERRYREIDGFKGPLDPIFGDIQDDIKGNMMLITSVSNVSLQNRQNEPTLSSKSEFDKILRRFYNANNR